MPHRGGCAGQWHVVLLIWSHYLSSYRFDPSEESLRVLQSVPCYSRVSSARGSCRSSPEDAMECLKNLPTRNPASFMSSSAGDNSLMQKVRPRCVLASIVFSKLLAYNAGPAQC